MTRASCATRIAAIRLPCSCAAATVWNGWGQPALWWACSRNGIARWKNANWLRATPSCFRSEEHTSELQSHSDLVCRLLLEKKNVLVNILKAFPESSASLVESEQQA